MLYRAKAICSKGLREAGASREQGHGDATEMGAWSRIAAMRISRRRWGRSTMGMEVLGFPRTLPAAAVRAGHAVVEGHPLQ